MNKTAKIRVESKLLAIFGMLGFIATATVLAIFAYLSATPASLMSEVLKAVLVALLLIPLCYLCLNSGLLTRGKNDLNDISLSELKDWPIIDPMTGTFNRRGITITLLELMALAGRYGRQLSVAMIGIDDLSQVNEEYGSKVGDVAIESIAETLSETLRMPDRIGRYAYDDFLLVLPETDLDSARQIAERIRQAAAETEIRTGVRKKIQLTVSIGLTQYRDGEDIEHLVSRATQLMGDAKNRGRNQVVTSELTT